MTDTEAENAFEALKEALTSFGLDWVNDQVEAEVREGRLIPVRKDALANNRRHVQLAAFSNMSQNQRGRIPEYLVRHEYTALERLSIQLDAITYSAIDPVMIRNVIRDILQHYSDALTSIQFVHNEDRTVVTEISINDGVLLEDQVEWLSGLVRQLRSQMSGGVDGH